jgi:hypothetical protein
MTSSRPSSQRTELTAWHLWSTTRANPRRHSRGFSEHGQFSGFLVPLEVSRTAWSVSASDVANILRAAHFRVALIRDMDSWLQRHAVFVTAVSGALYKLDVSSKRLSSDSQAVRNLIVAIRQGWAAMDRRRIAPAPVTLRAIFEWVPMPFAVLYWRRLFRFDERRILFRAPRATRSQRNGCTGRRRSYSIER